MTVSDSILATDPSHKVLVLAPAPLLTITIELRGDDPDVHLHAGGQGFWLARMISSLGAPVLLCGSFGGETGWVVRTLIEREGIAVRAVASETSNVAYVHDRREGQRTVLAEMPPAPLSRHDVDSLYNAALVEGLKAQVCVLGGPPKDTQLPSDVYRRLAADLRGNGKVVIADLSGELLSAALAGGVDVLKVSSEQFLEDGRLTADDEGPCVTLMHELRAAGAEAVVLSRADQPTLVSVANETTAVTAPTVQPVDESGGGDALTAGIAAGLSRGDDLWSAVRLGMAAGRLNVTRRGLATGRIEDIEQMAEHVRLQPLSGDEPVSLTVDDLAAVEVPR